MLQKLHIWRCTADVKPCREFYGSLSAVDGVYEEWRRLVSMRPEARWKFVQTNTFLENAKMVVREYEESDEGIIQSWADRNV